MRMHTLLVVKIKVGTRGIFINLVSSWKLIPLSLPFNWKRGRMTYVFTIKACVLCSSIEMMLNYDSKVDPKSGFIQTLCRIPQGSWTQGRKVVQAVDGSSIAAVVSRSNGIMVAVYIYYQDLNLHLKEQVWSPDAGRWVSSEHLLIINVLSRGDS